MLQGQDEPKRARAALGRPDVREVSKDTAARLLKEALQESEAYRQPEESDLQRVRRIVRLGVECYRQKRYTVTFAELVELLLCRKCHRRERTLREIMQLARRLARVTPDWPDRLVRFISPQECRNIIVNAYPTIAMQHKARTLMHGLFSFALRQGWSSINPLDQVEFPRAPGRRINAMDIDTVRRLLEASLMPEHLPCAPALGLLLWAGVRPRELEHLRWRNINLAERIITVPAEHAKTGGARQITMQPVLQTWLLMVSTYRIPSCLIVPRSWSLRWRMLRQAAGITEWDPDILRHTFASYHLQKFRNLHDLQVDMGHGTTDLLRTRYLNMEGVTSETARQFWGMDLKKLRPRKSAPTASDAPGRSPAKRSRRNKTGDFPMLDD